MSDEVKIPLPRSLQEIVGALLFASPDPLTAAELRAAVKAVEPEAGENREVMDVYKTCTNREIDQALKGLEKALEVAGCGFQLVCTGGTYRLQTTACCGRYVRALLKLDRPSRLGRASLETLAIVAYRQPLTKSEIEAIRGVDVSANLKTLVELQLVRLVGRSELPGHPFLYGTTPFFLEHFGLSNLQELNDLDPTLQRSNPRLKAEAYKKPVKTELETAAEEASKEKAAAEEAIKKAEADKEADETTKADVEDGPVQGDLLAVEEKETDIGEKATDDDDIFIDDTPDEFDDEDDDEDEGEDDEEESDADGEES